MKIIRPPESQYKFIQKIFIQKDLQSSAVEVDRIKKPQ